MQGFGRMLKRPYTLTSCRLTCQNIRYAVMKRIPPIIIWVGMADHNLVSESCSPCVHGLHFTTIPWVKNLRLSVTNILDVSTLLFFSTYRQSIF